MMPTTVMITMVTLALDDDDGVGAEGEDDGLEANGAGGGSILQRRPCQDIKARQERLRGQESVRGAAGRKQSF